MNIRDDLRVAASQGTLLELVAEVPWNPTGEWVEALSELHNAREIDFLSTLSEERLKVLERQVFFRIRHAFNETLPFIECGAEEAISTCRLMAKKAGIDITKGQEYDALERWLQKSRQRVDDTITWVESGVEVDPNILLLALVAGAQLVPTEFSELALAYSRREDPNFRLGALSALGSIGRKLGVAALDTILERFDEAIGGSQSDQEVATSLGSALRLLTHFGNPILEQIERMHLKACDNSGPITRYEIANHLTPVSNLQNYSGSMIDAAFNTMAYADKSELGTIEQIDFALYQWDLDEDRQRVIELLKVLLTHSDSSISIGSLDNFKHRLWEQGGALIGWYVISLLLTGDQRLCGTANDLLPYREAPKGLDVNLRPFDLDQSCVLFLARKIIGYCLVNARSASALLLACLRAVPEAARGELEILVFSHFLINFPSSIERLQFALALEDPAERSVTNLRSRLDEYFDNIVNPPKCRAFSPSARERQLQAYRQKELGQEIWRTAEEQSLFSKLADKANILYGTASISYAYHGTGAEPKRSERPFTVLKQETEIPRLQVLDPVGLEYSLFCLRLEEPPL